MERRGGPRGYIVKQEDKKVVKKYAKGKQVAAAD